MSLILRDQYSRSRQRHMTSIVRTLLFTAVVVGMSVISFRYGEEKSARDVTTLKSQLLDLNKQLAIKDEAITTIKAQTQTAIAEYSQLQQDFEQAVPQGDIVPLIKLLKKQLDKGMKAERLAFIIRSAQPPRNCTNPETKRFVVSTPLYQGPDSSVGFANNVITITAKGEAGKNDQGQPEAWFDTGKPVRIDLTELGGETQTETGLLPLHHTMVSGNREYRFTFAEGPQSFILVTADSCDYNE